jgi:hypothetical protein
MSVVFYGAPASDDLTPMVGVWFARTRDAIDDSQQPAVYLVGHNDEGGDWSFFLRPADGVLEELELPDVVPRWIAARLRAIDLAGNRSEPSDIALQIPPRKGVPENDDTDGR